MSHLPAAFRLRPLSVAIMAALLNVGAEAAPVNWVPNADGLWDTAANWSSSPTLPVGADDVTIDVGGATVRTITLQAINATVRSLVSQENITLAGGSLSLTAASSINGNYVQSGGALTGVGELTLNGAGSSWTAGQMLSAGKTTNTGTFTIGGVSLKDISTRTLRNEGTLNWNGGGVDFSGRIRTGSGATIENAAQWNDQNTFATRISNDFGGPASTFTNSGTYTKSGVGTTEMAIAFDNSGTVDIQVGTLTLSGGGNDVSGDYSGAGSLEFSGGTHDLDAASTIAVGNVRFSGGTTTIAGGYTTSGTTTVTGGTANLIGATTSLGSGLSISGGALNLSNSNATVGSFTQAGGELGGAGTVTLTGVGSSWTGGRISGTGKTTNTGTLALIGAAVKDIVTRTLRNEGTVNWTSGGSDNTGRIRTGSGATLENAGQWNDQNAFATSVSNDFGGPASTFKNSGTYTKSGAGRSEFNIAFDNSGTVDIQAGTLALSGGGNDVSGDYSGAGTLEFSGGTHDLDAASTIAVGNVRFSGGSTTIAGSYTTSGTTTVTGGISNLTGTITSLGSGLSISGGVLNLSGSNATVGSFTQSGGELGGAGTVNLTGVGSSWTGGRMSGTGKTTNTGTLALSGAGLKDMITRTLRNEGTVNWSGGAFDSSGRIRTGSGATIENTAQWNDQNTFTTSISNDFGGSASTFKNTGTYTKTGAGTTEISNVFDHSGTLDIRSGTLRLGGGGAQTGTTKIATGTTLDLFAGTHTISGAGVELNGRLLLSGASVTATGALVAAANSTLELSSGTFTVDGTVNTGGYIQSGGDLAGTGTVTLTGAGSSWTGGRMSATGKTTNTGTLNLSGGGVKDLLTRTLRNEGTVNWSGGAFDSAGRIRTGSGATIENTAQWNDQNALATSLSNDFGGSASSFTNSGTYTKTGAGTTDIANGFDNSGTLDVRAGNLILNSDVSQHNGSTLGGGTWKVSGAGALNLTKAGALNIITNHGDVTLDGATASFARINTLTNNQGAFRLLGSRNFTAVGDFTNSGVLQLAGGTFSAPSLSNTGTGEIFGFGTVTPTVLNSGLVRAAGGTLTATGGIDGQSGTLQSDAGATLALGANSDGDFLINNGNLALGTANVTVAQDYTNANFGNGNSFNARANVTGSGQILASGNVAQALTGEVSSGTSAAPNMVFGNIHVGDAVTKQFSIANTGTSGPALRGALQTNINGGNLTDTRLSGSGTTAGNFGPVAVNSASAPLSVTLTGSSAGVVANQRVAVVNNFDNVGEQVLGITGAVYRYANPTAHSPEPVNFGNRRVGDVTSQVFSLTNNVPADGFSEGLDASIGSATAGVTSNAGSFGLLSAGATNNTSLVVGIDTTSAGHKAGTATISLASNGAGSSELGITALTSQTVNVSGDVFRLASASAHSPEPVVFTNRHVGDGASQALSLTNTAANDGFSERLNASVGGVTGNALSNNGSFTLLNAGATNNSSLTVGINTSTAGHKVGTALISLASDGAGTSGFSALSLATQTVNVSGDVYRLASASAHTPEPVNFGNRRVGDVTSQALSLTNNVAADGFSERLDASIGSATTGVTSNGGSFSLLGAGATNNTSLSVGIDTISAGHKAGTATIALTSNGAGTSELGTTALTSQTVNVSGDVFRLASASAHSPEPVVFSNRHVGDGASQALSLTNTAANDGFSERLNGSIGGVTGNATSNGGSFTLLNSGATDGGSLMVGINTTTAGHKVGTATISLASDGAGTSGFSALALGTQTVNVSGDVYRLAAANVMGAVQFGNVHVGDVVNQALSLTNTAANDGFSERLDASFNGVSDSRILASGAVTGLGAGASDNTSLVIGLDTSTAGSLTGFATVKLSSNGAGTSGLGVTSLANQNLGVTTNVAVYRFAEGAIDNVQPLNFGAHRVGDVVSAVDVAVRNAAANDGFSEALNASVGFVDAGFSASGAAALVGAGASNVGAIKVGLDTTTAGAKSGHARVDYVSDGAGSSNLGQTARGADNIALSGKVYGKAVASVDTPTIDFGIVHVSDVVGAQGVTVRNLALGSLTDTLLGSIAAVPAGFTSTGTLGTAGLAQGQTSVALTVGLSTANAGIFSGNANVSFASHNDELTDLALTNGSVALSAQVNNYASGVLAKAAGDGSFAALPGGHFEFDFGTLTQGGTGVFGLLSLTNFVSGPSDSLGADFDINAGAFSLGDFTNFNALQAGNGRTMSVSFEPLVAGLFEHVVRINLFGENASGFHGSLGTFELTLRADVQAVPVPGAVWMFGSALLGIAGLRRRKAV